MRSQAIKDQHDFFAYILDQRLRELNKLASIERLVNDHLAGLAFVGHRGNHGEFFTVAVLPTNAMGVLPAGAELLPRTSMLTSAVSSTR